MTVTLYEVGGSLRDELMGRPTKDRDFVAVCPGGWDEVKAWCDEHLDSVFLVKDEFLTVRGHLAGKDIDVVMARKERGYHDGRHPSEVEPGSLQEDLERRDFTMNALARQVDINLEPTTGVIIDLHGGTTHIHNRVLTTCGPASEIFADDLLRLVRAIRFSVTHDMDWDQEIFDRLVVHGDHWAREIEHSALSIDRIRDELRKMFVADTTRALETLNAIHQDLRRQFFKHIWLLPTSKKRK